MVKPLTQHQTEIITELFKMADGSAGVFYAADDLHHSPLYWMAHESRGVIEIQKRKRKGKVFRSIALTDIGVAWCIANGINDRPIAYMPPTGKRPRVNIAFQLPAADPTIGQVGRCKRKQEFIPVIRLAMTLYTTLGYAGMKALVGDISNVAEALSIAYAEIEGLQAELENERQRLALERAALAAQTLEVKQFHDIFRDIDTKLGRLQNPPQPRENGHSSDLRQADGQSQTGGPKQMAVPQFSAPRPDDDEDMELEIKADTGRGKTVSENFLKSILALNT